MQSLHSTTSPERSHKTITSDSKKCGSMRKGMDSSIVQHMGQRCFGTEGSPQCTCKHVGAQSEHFPFTTRNPKP